jgi:predicted alpha/beta hydrolase
MHLTLMARDGTALAASFFEPAGAPRGGVLINSGTGIPRKFYGSFATYLAEQGFAALTYDYRGVGESAAPRDASMEAWGRIDQPSMLDHLARLAPDVPRAIVGHCFGGQVLGLADNIADVRAAVLICSQSGHWRHWPGARRKLRMFALWWLFIPVLTALTGRFPGAWVGTADLPKGIARNWARWGRSPHYVCDARGQALRPYNDAVGFPIRWLSFTDDPVAPEEAVAALLSYYPNAMIERCVHTPADLGVPVVGHFGFFRKWMPRTAWQPVATWLGERLHA